MMMNRGRQNGAAQRFNARRLREDAAPRLLDQVPGLVRLELTITEEAGLLGSSHVRHVVVDRAPALFIVPCGDSRCAGGEHDLTPVVMRALRVRQPSFEGTDPCRGSLGSTESMAGGAPCCRVVRITGTAEYRA